MKQRYTKPLARDLGDSIPYAQGNTCLGGSIAQGSTLGHCTYGARASGGSCFVGDTVSGCAHGAFPNAYECRTGGNFV